MLEIVAMAFAAAFGLVFLVLKFGPLRKVLAFDILIDIVLTAVLMWSMAGTYTGIMVAIVAGAMISSTLWMLKKMFPPDSLTAHGWVKATDRGLIELCHDGLKRI